MKLILAIIHDDDAGFVMDMLNEKGFIVTKLASTGGFLRSGNTTLICGVEDTKVKEVTAIIEKICKSRRQVVNYSNTGISMSDGYVPLPVEVNVGGATIFVLNVDEFIKA